MKSGPLYLGVLTASAAVWLALYLELAIPLSPSGQQVVSALPCLALIWFGCWSLGTISLNLIRLRECTDAAVELREQIAAARNDLRARGLGDIFDADAK
ncbi:dolichol-phosphate mannosyltransferase subunit 3 [Chrysochromulina tobinii]|uniref:Dolichol-phosphate mannosyltransferase subunit 3 n=1 Tax=Chrysochromulina tobinii TaxID=1460289 RepID=A0A0M0J828_9EUKA|nr:dolichol-phosphate mannosyltransferase subunit 3 [Chrysochromulina tobinii]|eukprot:KOO22756.1 dolichol-phosphate mannosyltransferase subunit 3 [Chrysochromulina sp. CCMP291]